MVEVATCIVKWREYNNGNFLLKEQRKF